MQLEAGRSLGQYTIVAQLGAGGMGEVYRARDSKLDREVALKILPAELSTDDERIARFEREARALAALNHPNIATLYGFEEAEGQHFLVMELVEGEELAHRLEPGPLAEAQLLSSFIEIAEGLEAAHAKGIVHRDLKPANIKIDDSGRAKILDFGLALALTRDSDEGDPRVSNSPTLTLAATRRGEVLGTAAYMSPEQATGQAVDERTDIWAFGACLFESLTGRRLFDATDVTSTLAAVLRDEVDLTELPESTPSGIVRLLRRCLERDLRQRLQHIGDARIELQDVAAGSEAQTTEVQSSRGRSSIWIVASAIVAVFAAALSTLTWFREPDSQRHVVRSLLTPPASTPLRPTTNMDDHDLTLSPDGRRLAYVSVVDGKDVLYTRLLSDLAPIALAELASGGGGPFFSPDGEWLGFFSGNALRKVAVRGDTPITLVEGSLFPSGATWTEDGQIVLATYFASGLWKVDADGGELVPFTTTETAGANHLWPSRLPGDLGVLFTKVSPGAAAEQIAVVSMDGTREKVLAQGGNNPRFMSSGHILYGSEGSLWALRFDPTSWDVDGEPVRVASNVSMKTGGATNFAVSNEGSLVFLVGRNSSASQMVVVDGDGRESLVAAPPGSYYGARFSPDGARVAYSVDGRTDIDVWVSSLDLGAPSRLTTEPGVDDVPLWAPNGQDLVFASIRAGDGVLSLYEMSVDSGGAAKKLFQGQVPGNLVPYDWSRDGQRLLFVYGSPENLDIGLVERGSPSDWRPLLATTYIESSPSLSPDGSWIAYSSNRSGAAEIYVQRFPELGDRRRISTAGGEWPVWSSDGLSLFYVENRRRLIALDLEDPGGATTGSSRVVLEGDYQFGDPAIRSWDLHPDGDLVLLLKSQDSGSGPGPDHLGDVVLIQNFDEELRRLLP